MSNLKSQQSTKTGEDHVNLVPILSGTSNFAHFNKTLTTHLNTNFGAIGHSINHKTPLTLNNPGPKPDENDFRRHPVSKEIIVPNERPYEQLEPTQLQTATPNFDLTSLPLSKTGQRNLDAAKADWYKDQSTWEKFHLLYKAQDVDCLNFILNHVSPDAKEIVQSHVDYTAFETLPVTDIGRSAAYISIIAKQFSTGNATSTVDEMIKFFSQHQGDAEINSPAAHFNNLNEQWARIYPILDQCPDKAAIMTMLRTMVAIQSLDQNHRPTLRALEIYLQTYPDFKAMQNYPALQASVLAAATSDLARLKRGTSEQSSAFIAKALPTPLTTPTTTTSSYGLAPRPGKGPHCPTCFRVHGRYYYHPQDQCRTKTSNAPKTPPAPTTAPKVTKKNYAQLAARIAAVESAAAANPSPTAQPSPAPSPVPTQYLPSVPPDITPQQFNALLATFTVNGAALGLYEDA
eukprot:gene11963-13553_t